MNNDVLTFTRNTALAELPPTEPGVAIMIGSEPSLIGNNRLWLHGAYQIDTTYASKLNVRPLHKALVITQVSDRSNTTKNLVGDIVLFSDDEIDQEGMRAGYFNYDLTDWLYMYERRRYYITVSLGKFISNTLDIEVNPVPFKE